MIALLPAAARAIVLHENNILVMRRNKMGKLYMVTPGGRLEAGEDPEVALIRELSEETTIKVANQRLVFIEEPNNQLWGTQFIYLCDYVSGEPQLHPDSDEQRSNLEGKNLYKPMWLPLNSFPHPDFPFRSPRLAEEINLALKHGFPEKPKQWTLDPPVVE